MFLKLILFFVLVCEITISQVVNDIQKNYTIRDWTTDNGLPQNSINDIYQTADGYIWLITYSGFSRFDGIKFTNLNSSNTEGITGNRLVSLFPINKSDFLVIEETGKIIIYENDIFHSFNSALDFKNYWIKKYYPQYWDEIEYYAVFINNLGVKVTKAPRNIKLENDNNVFLESNSTKDGKIWVCRKRNMFYISESDSVPKFKQFFNSNVVLLHFSDQDDNLWILIEGKKNEKMLKYREGYSEKTMKKNAIISDFVPSAVDTDKDGSIWFGTLLNGIYKYDGTKRINFSKEHGLKDVYVKKIYFDREENIWIGTNAAGLVCLRKKRVNCLSEKNGLSHPVILSIHQDHDKGFWICTNGGGLDYLRNGKITNYSNKIGISSVFLYSAYTDSKNDLWVGIETNSILKYSKGKRKIFKPIENVPNQFTKAIYEDSKHQIWVGTGNGLACYSNGVFKTYTVEQGLINNSVISLLEDKDSSLWIGTNGGISHLKDQKFTNYSLKDGLRNEIVRSIYQDSIGTLWFGTYGGGLHRLKDGKFISIKSENGLFDDVVHNIIEDKMGRFWMSCNRGVYFIPKKDLYDFTDGKIGIISCISIRKSDGMLNDECNGGFQPSACLTEDNKIYYPTINGVAIIDINRIKVNEIAPQIVIEKFIVNNQLMDLKSKIEIDPGGKNFELSYTGFSFSAPEKIKFKYKLEGLDTNWVNAENKRVAYYTYLPPGKYKFRIIACNGDGIWNNSGASIDFYLAPHFYETWYFYLFVAASLFAMGFGIKWMRDINLRKRKIELEEIVKERTQVLIESNLMKDKLFSIISHDLRGPIGSVCNTLELLDTERETMPEKMKFEFMDTAKKISQNVYALLEELLSWTKKYIQGSEINRKNLPLDEVVLVNLDFLTPLAKSKDIAIIYTPNKDLTAYFDRDSITTVIRNLMSNAFKFTNRGGEINISLSEKGNFIEVTISDTGTGISEENMKKLFSADEKFIRLGTSGEKGNGFGLLMCQDFVIKNGGKIWVESKLGKGTSFKFTLPRNNS
jgi:ligand-binding sensor domain-containing protein/signal transduction histidine kinase